MSIIKNQIQDSQKGSLISSAKRSIKTNDQTKSALPRSDDDDADDGDETMMMTKTAAMTGTEMKTTMMTETVMKTMTMVLLMKVMRRSIDGCDDGHEDNVNDVVMT